jgi:nicotinamidase-related amidase
MITALDKNTALVLIDLQKGIVSYPTAHPMADILANAAKLVEAFRKAGQPIVIVNVITGGAWTKSRKEPAPPRPAPAADWAEITPEIKTQSTDTFITKQSWGAFFGTELDNELKKRGVTGIVLSGVSTSKGVDTTARQASALGYNLTFATDAMTDTAADAHNAAIKYIFPGIGEVGVAEDVIKLL